MIQLLRDAAFGLFCIAAFLVPLVLVLTAVDLIAGQPDDPDGLFGITTIFYVGAFWGVVIPRL